MRRFGTARGKLNAANLTGTLVLAGIIGGAFQSWAVFWIAWLALLACAVLSRDIR